MWGEGRGVEEQSCDCSLRTAKQGWREGLGRELLLTMTWPKQPLLRLYKSSKREQRRSRSMCRTVCLGINMCRGLLGKRLSCQVKE